MKTIIWWIGCDRFGWPPFCRLVTLERGRGSWLFALVVYLALVQPVSILAEPVVVRQLEGLSRGFMVLQTPDGNTIADGDLTQVAKGNRLTSHMLFHFKDGSIYDETFVYTQWGTFRLLSYHLVQKGPAFKQPIETTIEASTGQVTVRYTDDDGKEKVVTERLKLPADLANGMVPLLLKNVQPNAPSMTVSMLATTPKPRLVKLVITPAGEEPFSVGGSSRKAMRYVVKVDIGGAAGFVAPMIGQQPPDTSVWILGGEAPAFLKSEGPLCNGGAIWRIETVSPAWPQAPPKK